MDNTKRIVNKTLLDDIADAIREKEGSSESIVASTFPERILGIETGTDMSDATATTDDILEGKTAYLSDGSKHSGTMQTWDGTITGSFEYAYPYADFDILITGSSTVYSGYCPSIIGNGIFNRFDEVNPFFSSNWDTIRFKSGAMEYAKTSRMSFLSSTIYKIAESMAFFQASSLETPCVNFAFVSVSAFAYCSKIPYFDFDNTQYLTGELSIGGSAFAFCQPSFIHLKANTLKLGQYCFQGFGNSEHNTSVFLEANEVYLSANLLFTSNLLSLLEISNIATGIGSNFCSGASFLQEVSLTFNLSNINISSYAFYFCKSLSKVTFSFKNGLSTIELRRAAFIGCQNLSEYSYFEKTNLFDNSIFANTGLISVYRSVALYNTNIYHNCFYSCSNLKYVYYSGITGAMSSAFYNCKNLSYIGPATYMYSVGTNTFYNCQKLKSFVFENTSNYTGSIGIQAFYNCSSLESMYICNFNIALLNVNAFANTPLSDSTYLGYYGSIYVPESLYSSYIASTNWVQYSERFVSITEAEMEQIITNYNNVSYVEEIENE